MSAQDSADSVAKPKSFYRPRSAINSSPDTTSTTLARSMTEFLDTDGRQPG